jgi:hypothetical protein
MPAPLPGEHKQAAADHSCQLALAAQNDRTAPSVQLTGPAFQITGHPGAPSPAPSAPGNAGRQPVVPRRITPGTNGPKVKTTPSASTPPPVTGRHRPRPRADAGVNAAGVGDTVDAEETAGATPSPSPTRFTLAELAAQQGGETAPYTVPATPTPSATTSPAPTATPSPTRSHVRSEQPAKGHTSGPVLRLHQRELIRLQSLTSG